ncbi:hypothetical protein K438DRAFT_1776643 [Mycena galopus ATCC 62051]|nr:hypothetical protein K438DRAFT_1776643 [Mycena galopus ATCC 62051]
MPEHVGVRRRRGGLRPEQENDLSELHANRIGPANGGVHRYHENGYSGGRRGPTRPAVHIRRRTGCGSEGNKATGGKHSGSGLGRGKVGNARVGSLSLSRRGDDEYECPCLAVFLMPLPNAYQKELKNMTFKLHI